MTGKESAITEIMNPANWPVIWYIWGTLGLLGGILSDFVTELITDYFYVADDMTSFGFAETLRRAAIAFLIAGTFDVWLAHFYMNRCFEIRDMIGAAGSMGILILAFSTTYATFPIIKEQFVDWLPWLRRRAG